MDAREKACMSVLIVTAFLMVFTWYYSVERAVQVEYQTDPYIVLFDDYMGFQIPRLTMHMPSEINSTFHVRIYLMNQTGSLYRAQLANLRKYKVIDEAYNITYNKPADLFGYGNGSDYVLEIDAYRSLPIGDFEKHLYPAYKVRVVVFSWDLQKTKTKSMILVEHPYAEHTPKIAFVAILIIALIVAMPKRLNKPQKELIQKLEIS